MEETPLPGPAAGLVCERLSVRGIPVTLVYRGGLEGNGKRPCLVLCYGAYGERKSIAYSPAYTMLASQGWLVVYAHVRGGGEVGRAWYEAATRQHKANSVADLKVRSSWA